MALEKASITNLQSGERIAVMFNPEEYALEISNNFSEIGIPGLGAPPLQYVRGSATTLKMELFFDTLEARRDVRGEAGRITGLLEQDPATKAPPVLLFAWGGFNFQCVLESVSQRVTLFIEDGTPVRATLSVSFKEYHAFDIEVRRGLFLGPPSVINIVEGETLSGLADRVLGKAEAWREIADLNEIEDPLDLVPGSQLLVPLNTRRIDRG